MDKSFWSSSAVRMAYLAAIAGVLVAVMVLPLVGGLALTVRDGASGFLNLPADIHRLRPAQPTRLVDVNGTTIAEIGDKRRDPVPIEDIAPVMVDAIVAIEDERFHEHSGVDFRSVFRAAVRTAQGSTQGGSTLTQQYVKNVLVESAGTAKEAAAAREVTLSRKVRELRYALGAEERMSKRDILEGYLNISYFGNSVYGVEGAARRYFSVSAKDLRLEQAALLAGLVKGPALYDPLTRPEEARDRRDTVLDSMARTGAVSEQEARAAQRRDLGLDLSPPPTPPGCHTSDYPFFCAHVLSWVEAHPGLGDSERERAQWIRRGGLTIHTTLDVRMQEAAQTAVEDFVPPTDPSGKVAVNVLVDPATGGIRAMAQNREYGFEADKPGTTSVNFAVDAAYGGSSGFQAGSTFKAFTIAAALKAGMGFTTSFDSPRNATVKGMRKCSGEKLPTWHVRNHGDSTSGKHDMLSGTRHSVNTYFAQLQKEVGLCETAEMARTLGVERADGEPLAEWNSLTLGDQEVSPLAVAGAYAVFAARGVRCEPRPVSAISDGVGTDRLAPVCARVLPRDVADATAHVLRQPFASGGTAEGLAIDRPVAGKTGTTDNAAAAWFAGFTPDLAGAVALGDPRGATRHPLRGVVIGGQYHSTVYGGTLPGPIWQETMEKAVEDMPKSRFPRPPKGFEGGEDARRPQEAEQKAEAEDPEAPAEESAEIPDVIGQEPEEAAAALEDTGLRPVVGEVTVPSDTAEGRVASTNPPTGSHLPEGAKVNVFLSRGR
ncbi:transglycosylase domain-containing protein [Streptomonospora sp. S1-112]|uniref:Transglycosylase domain-containing protein n=1 Tax=Streptomonospora mangrovi TaxID=2883123 RepID=A0A9X3SI41_9ACTN|nr:transglycosylase domain-containing protein [Streptomonospora mangrovi]MDA0565889.1 transglycosylase domain-containing protein [Streptomonospora mangrovi]